MHIVCLQTDTAWENIPANRDRIAALFKRAAPVPGDLVILPELCVTGFTMNAAEAAEPAGGRTESFMAGLAAGAGAHLLAGLAVDAGGRIANQAVLFGPDGAVACRYDKMRSFTPAGEHEHYAAGDAVAVSAVDDIAAAPLICYDLRFPELFRAAAGEGAELYAVIANWPAARADHWDVLLAARAIENQAYVAGVNRVGSDPFNAYAGRTAVYGPRGERLAAGDDAEGFVRAAVDPAAVRQWREEFPALRDGGVGPQ